MANATNTNAPTQFIETELEKANRVKRPERPSQLPSTIQSTWSATCSKKAAPSPFFKSLEDLANTVGCNCHLNLSLSVCDLSLWFY
jgi:hypothetical protein